MYKRIPKIIHCTHYNKSIIPIKVWYNLYKYANDYKVNYYSDEDCINFLKEYFPPEIHKIFIRLKTGAHKADLFRYCVLYIKGGVYIDIKIEPKVEFNKIFDHNLENTLYTIISKVANNHIFQAVIATYPKNKIFLPLISDFLHLQPPYFIKSMGGGNKLYHIFTINFYKLLQRILKKNDLENKKYKFKNDTIILFIEKNIKLYYEKKNRYGGHHKIFNTNNKYIMNSRYNDYPW